MSDLSAKNVPIVIATKHAKCLPVLFASIDQYVPLEVEVIVSGSDLRLPRHKTTNLPNYGHSFGESYNYVVNYAFTKHDHVIVANDDIVVNPNSYTRLVDDYIKLMDADIAWMTARSDYAKGVQNIRVGSQRNGIRFVEENQIQEIDVCVPLFALISKMRWIDYPPINWYSDDIQSLKMRYEGFRNFVSTSYVHHVGSSTIGMDHKKNHDEAMEWMKDNEPEFYEFFLA
jgi:hypothetical protein